jgi:ABC-type multidrug transport system fused ATPase/permease subunit
MARGRLNSGSKAEADLPKAKINRTSLKQVVRLLSYVKPHRGKFIAAFIFLVLSSLTGLAFPAFLGALIDVAQGNKSKYPLLPNTLTGIGELAFIILFAQAFVSFFRVVFFVQVAERSLADIRRDTYFS